MVRGLHRRFLLNDFPVENALPAAVGQVLFWSGYYAGFGVARYYSEPLNQRIRMASGLVFKDSRKQDSRLTT